MTIFQRILVVYLFLQGVQGVVVAAMTPMDEPTVAVGELVVAAAVTAAAYIIVKAGRRRKACQCGAHLR
ncbi:hypothetical protein ACWEFL_00945 [Streptomyces sp. NPDC004838]